MICLGCGRPLKNKTSIDRGYGPSCYKKFKKEHLQDNTEKSKELDELDEIDGQIDILEEVRRLA